MQAELLASQASTVHFMRSPRLGLPAGPAPGASCSSCHLREMCLPSDLQGQEVQALDKILLARRRVKAGQTLYREGDKFQNFHAARSGTFKSVMTLRDGREQVTGFHMAGEFMGLDGAAHGSHATACVALEDGEICVIPYDRLSEFSAGNAGMRHVLERLMAREIVQEHRLMMMLGSMNAEERLGNFLLGISQRMKARGWSPREFHLRMSRAEIGSYLGMKLETVSRTFSAFQAQGLLEVDKRHIRIRDVDALARSFESRLH